MMSLQSTLPARIKTPTAKNAERERSRVRSLRNAFQALQSRLPSVPPDTKLSKLDILILATNYIAQLTRTLEDNDTEPIVVVSPKPASSMAPVRSVRPARYLKYYHPIKKWPMRFRLYSLMDGDKSGLSLSSPDCNNNHAQSRNNGEGELWVADQGNESSSIYNL